MKYNSLIIIFVFYAWVAKCQSYKSSLGLEINLGKSYTNRTDQNNVYNSISVFNAGLEYRKSIRSSRLYFETGIFYSERGFKMNNTNLLDSLGNPSEILTISFKRDYISVPLGLSLILNKIAINVSPEIYYLLNRRIYYNDDLFLRINESKTRLMAMGYQASLGYECSISSKLLIKSNVFYSRLINGRSINYGVGVGIIYTIQKTSR